MQPWWAKETSFKNIKKSSRSQTFELLHAYIIELDDSARMSVVMLYTVLSGWMSGLSRAIVMQLRRWKTAQYDQTSYEWWPFDSAYGTCREWERKSHVNSIKMCKHSIHYVYIYIYECVFGWSAVLALTYSLGKISKVTNLHGLYTTGVYTAPTVSSQSDTNSKHKHNTK